MDLQRKWFLRERGTRTLLVMTALALAITGCDTTAVFEVNPVEFKKPNALSVIGAHPVTIDEATNEVTPACTPGDTVDGFRMNFVLESTAAVGTNSGNKDNSLREGSVVEGNTIETGVSLSPDDFSFDFSTADAFNNTAGFQTLPSASPFALQYHEATTNSSERVAVALLIDHSGSMLGSVDPSYYHEAREEVGLPISEATDQNRERFFKAGSAVVDSLNSGDLLIAWLFNEDGLGLLCDNNEATPANAENACFGTNRNNVWNASTKSGALYDQATLAEGAKPAKGRSPLWKAVDHAWDFLNLKAPNDAKHILVITDSPDTCALESSYFIPDSSCSDVGYATFRAKMISAENPIPLSFIQMQSKGYQSPDPAQLEASCMTGGTYQWINNLGFSLAGGTLGSALQGSLAKARLTFGGMWGLDVKSKTDSIASGHLVAYQGTMNVGAGTLNLAETANFQSQGSDLRDSRLLVRHACSGDNSCSGADEADCYMDCVEDGSMCKTEGERPRLTNAAVGCCCGGTAIGTCDVFHEPCCKVVDTSSSQYNFFCN